MEKPNKKPNNPNFSSGPCAKRPGWKIENLIIESQLFGIGSTNLVKPKKQVTPSYNCIDNIKFFKMWF